MKTPITEILLAGNSSQPDTGVQVASEDVVLVACDHRTQAPPDVRRRGAYGQEQHGDH